MAKRARLENVDERVSGFVGAVNAAADKQLPCCLSSQCTSVVQCKLYGTFPTRDPNGPNQQGPIKDSSGLIVWQPRRCYDSIVRYGILPEGIYNPAGISAPNAPYFQFLKIPKSGLLVPYPSDLSSDQGSNISINPRLEHEFTLGRVLSGMCHVYSDTVATTGVVMTGVLSGCHVEDTRDLFSADSKDKIVLSSMPLQMATVAMPKKDSFVNVLVSEGATMIVGNDVSPDLRPVEPSNILDEHVTGLGPSHKYHLTLSNRSDTVQANTPLNQWAFVSRTGGTHSMNSPMDEYDPVIGGIPRPTTQWRNQGEYPVSSYFLSPWGAEFYPLWNDRVSSLFASQVIVGPPSAPTSVLQTGVTTTQIKTPDIDLHGAQDVRVQLSMNRHAITQAAWDAQFTYGRLLDGDSDVRLTKLDVVVTCTDLWVQVKADTGEVVFSNSSSNGTTTTHSHTIADLQWVVSHNRSGNNATSYVATLSGGVWPMSNGQSQQPITMPIPPNNGNSNTWWDTSQALLSNTEFVPARMYRGLVPTDPLLFAQELGMPRNVASPIIDFEHKAVRPQTSGHWMYVGTFVGVLLRGELTFPSFKISANDPTSDQLGTEPTTAILPGQVSTLPYGPLELNPRDVASRVGIDLNPSLIQIALSVTNRHMYAPGHLSASIIRYDALGTGQTLSVSGLMNVEVVSKASIAPYMSSSAIMSRPVSSMQTFMLLQILFNSDNMTFKKIYKKKEWEYIVRDILPHLTMESIRRALAPFHSYLATSDVFDDRYKIL